MTLNELKLDLQKYQYLEDTDIIDVAIASIISTRLQLGDPVWMILIGPSSGGKSQILRPLAITDPKFLHRVDDLTENTFLSGGNIQGGGDISLLNKIGPKGMIVVSDMTVIFSKAKESRNAILSQLRMIYDGEMTKFVGNKPEPLRWKGSLGILAGSTPSIYTSFEEVADMGERFIYYRMKDYDPEKATRLSMSRTLYGKELDTVMSDLYVEYIKEVISSKTTSLEDITLPEEITEQIIKVAVISEKIRTTTHTDFKDRAIDKIPIPAMPMRVALQLTTLAKGLYIMRKHENRTLGKADLRIINWCGYSLANEEKRACLKILATIPFDTVLRTQTLADQIGLATSMVSLTLQNMAATGILKRGGMADGLSWKILKEDDWRLIREIEGIKDTESVVVEREISSEEIDELEDGAQQAFDNF